MAVRRLSEITAPTTISEAAPLDLDLFNLQAGDDITLLLTDIVTRYGSVYVRAPSKTVGVVCDTILFTAANFVFLEDESAANKLTITHAPSGGVSATVSVPAFGTVYKKPILWTFTNFTTVKVGGSNLSMTFIGTHPGLGTGDYLTTPYADPTPKAQENVALIMFSTTTSASPDLFDWRANIRFTERYAITSSSTYAHGAYFGDAYRCKQVNIAGLFYATSGIYMAYGAKNVWYDPERTVFSDPYIRALGWNGNYTSDSGGRKVGTATAARMQFRLSGGSAYNTDSITGGVTFEYGAWNFVPRLGGAIGSAASPFIIRLKDWYVSGPNELGYPAGVTTQAGFQTILFKGDPADTFGNTSPFRFLRWIKLPSAYGDGAYNQTDNLIRVEANDFNNIQNYGYDMSFSGNWNTNFWRGQLFQFEFSTDPGGRTWGHVLRAADDMTFTDQITMLDTDTVTGSGTFSNITVSTATNVTSRDNVIRDTTITGAVTVNASTGTTTVQNVVFTGAARAVITVAAGTTVNAYALSAPAGSTVTGSGTFNYSATVGGTPTLRTLPFSVPTGDASLTNNGRPNPPSSGSVS